MACVGKTCRHHWCPDRYSRCWVTALDVLASRCIDCSEDRAMKALGPLTVADRDILALRTAREDSARSGD